MDKKEVLEQTYDSAIVVGMVAKKLGGVQLGVPETLKGSKQLILSLATGSLIINYLTENKYLPDLFKAA